MDDSGFFYGIGTGPGDADLLTIKASQIVRSCDVIVYVLHADTPSPALDTVSSLITKHQQTVGVDLGTSLVEPSATKEKASIESSVEDRLNDQKLDEAVLAITYHLRKGADVAFLCFEDPALCTEFNRIKQVLQDDFSCKQVPGIISAIDRR